MMCPLSYCSCTCLRVNVYFECLGSFIVVSACICVNAFWILCTASRSSLSLSLSRVLFVPKPLRWTPVFRDLIYKVVGDEGLRTLNKSGGRGDELSVDGHVSTQRVKRDHVVDVIVDDEAMLVMYSGALQQDVLSHARTTTSNPCLACTHSNRYWSRYQQQEMLIFSSAG